MKLLESRFSGVPLFRRYHVMANLKFCGKLVPEGMQKYAVLSHWAIISNVRKI
jgi:hypothetical protein